MFLWVEKKARTWVIVIHLIFAIDVLTCFLIFFVPLQSFYKEPVDLLHPLNYIFSLKI